MSEQVMRQVKPELLRYTLQTRPGLSAEDAELYFLAAIDDVSLACMLVQISTAHYENTLREAPHTPEALAHYRRVVNVVSISYQNPWEIIFEVIGAAGTVAAAVQIMYSLRSSRQKTQAETVKLRAEAAKFEAETRNLDRSSQEAAALNPLRERLEAHEKALEQIDLVSMLISKEQQDRRTRDLLAEVVLSDNHAMRIGDVDLGLRMLQARLASSVMSTLDKLLGPDATLKDVDQLSRLIADNTRLIASIQRLDEVERAVEVLDEEDPGQ